jgi:NTE family protein
MKKRVALVLSTGGARGLAQIGVIEEMEKNGYEITSIAGSSIGALIGGIYATGKLEKYKEWILKLDKLQVFKLVDFAFSKQGFIKGERVFNELNALIGDCQIEDLPLPYAAVAADILNQKEVIFRSGSLFEAIRASIAIPSVVTPHIINGVELVDGGVLNPIPVDVVKRTPQDLLLVVNVNGPAIKQEPVLKIEAINEDEKVFRRLDYLKEKLNQFLPKDPDSLKRMGYMDLMTKSFDLMQDKLTNLILEKHHPDITITIPRNLCGTFEFYRANEAIEAGRAAFHEAIYKNNQVAV